MSKKTVKKIAPVSRIVEGTEGRVLINVYSPGHEPKEFRVSIPDISGNSNLLSRNPENVAQAVIDGLRAKFGNRVG